MRIPTPVTRATSLVLISLVAIGVAAATAELSRAAPASAAAAGHAASSTVNQPFDLSLWDIDANDHRVEPYFGRDALWLDSGRALLRDDGFINGIIELDIAVSDVQGFAGVNFRDDGAGNGESFYIRSHLSGMPDASQYTPDFHGISGWQIYAGPRFNAPMELVHDRWMHMKVVVSGRRAAVYLDSDEPLLVIPELVYDERSGHIVLTASTAPARFANVQVQTLDDPPAIDGGAEADPVADTIVEAWSVSAPFAESSLHDRHEISRDDVPGDWQPLASGARGIANLARLSGVSPEANTVVAALSIDADEARTIPAHFGFSDRVRVYLNGRLLFSGDDGWRTRDYRYLGTIGLFDTVYLPLQPGVNQLWFAVSESFGGWGIVLDLPDREGLRIVPAS